MTETREVVTADEPGAARSYPWALAVWPLALVFLMVAVVRSWQVGIPIKDPGGEYFTGRLGISLGLFVPISALDAIWRTRTRRTPGAVWQTWVGRWWWRRLALAVAAWTAYQVVYLSYHNLKSWDVFNAPKDQMLLHWDRVLFLGHSPHVLLHDLLGQSWVAWVLAYWYETFGSLILVALVVAMVVPQRMRDSYVFIASGMWVWIFGVISYYAIPSLGPFWSAPQEFSGLPHMMIQDTQARYLGQRADMLADPHAHGSFAQISAFASLHVGISTFLFLMARYYGWRWLTRALGIFVAGTMVATVYLGWHFFVDDIAGLFIAWLGVVLGIKMIYPRGGGPRDRSRPALSPLGSD